MSEGANKISLREGKVIQMKHSLKISVTKEPVPGGVVSYRHVTVRERLLRYLLGEKQWLTIIVPGNSVKTLSIVEEGDENGEQSKTAS